jgi:hypothetical protein
MSPTPAPAENPQRNAVLAITVFLLFGILGAGIVAFALPAAFEIEWLCLFANSQPAAQRYVITAAIGGVVSWLAAVCVALMAYSPARPRLPVWIAAGWFTLYVAAGFVSATLTGSQPCRDEVGLF